MPDADATPPHDPAGILADLNDMVRRWEARHPIPDRFDPVGPATPEVRVTAGALRAALDGVPDQAWVAFLDPRLDRRLWVVRATAISDGMGWVQLTGAWR